MEIYEYINTLPNKVFNRIRNTEDNDKCKKHLIKHLEKINQKGITLSFWFMQDMHLFIKVKVTTLNKIVKEYKILAKKHPHGMVCPVTILKDGKDLRRVGKSCHVTKDGKVQLSDWITSISNDIDIKRILKL